MDFMGNLNENYIRVIMHDQKHLQLLRNIVNAFIANKKYLFMGINFDEIQDSARDWISTIGTSGCDCGSGCGSDITRGDKEKIKKIVNDVLDDHFNNA